MIIDCESCEVRGLRCGECVISVLIGPPASGEVPFGASIVQFDAPERRALDVLAAQGLVPRLRLVAAHPRRATPEIDMTAITRDTG